MRSLLIIFILLLISISTIGQTHNEIPVALDGESKYIIGIGNSEQNMFFDVLQYLQNSAIIKVDAICETHRVIKIKVLNSNYKSYEMISIQLLDEFPALLLFRKEDSIFTTDCKGEILKQ